MQAVLADWRTAPLDAKEKALFALLEKVVRDSASLSREAVDAARAAGWPDDALSDAFTVVSLFRFYNTWIDATGVADLPAAAYRMMGQRMAAAGYAPLEPAR